MNGINTGGIRGNGVAQSQRLWVTDENILRQLGLGVTGQKSANPSQTRGAQQIWAHKELLGYRRMRDTNTKYSIQVIFEHYIFVYSFTTMYF